MNVGDLVQIMEGVSIHKGSFGLLIDKTIESYPNGFEKFLVYKVLVDNTIISVPHKWLVHITDTHQTQEK